MTPEGTEVSLHIWMTKKTTIYIFLKIVTLPQKSQASSLGGVPEEGVVIIVDDSSIHVIALKGRKCGGGRQ